MVSDTDIDMDMDRNVRLALCFEAGGAIRFVRIRLPSNYIRLGKAILSRGGGERKRNVDCY